MKKILVGLTSAFLVVHSSANVYTSLQYQDTNQITPINELHSKDDDDDFWDHIDKNNLEKDVKEVWQKFKKQPTLTEIISKTDEYLKKVDDSINENMKKGNHFTALRSLEKGFNDLNFFNKKGFRKFFNVKESVFFNWYHSFRNLTRKWMPRFNDVKKQYSHNNEDSDFFKLKDILRDINAIEQVLENYIELNQKQKLNYKDRDIATEQQLKAIIKKYNIAVREFAILSAYPNLYNMKISIDVYREYVRVSNAIHLKLDGEIKQFINIFLGNVKRRLKKLDLDLDTLKYQDNKYEEFEKLHQRYLEYTKEIEFLTKEQIFKNNLAVFSEVNGLVLKIKNHFNSANKSMVNAFKTHFDNINTNIQKYLKTMTSEESWNEIEKLNTEFKTAHQLFKKMKNDHSELKLNYTEINTSITKVEKSLKQVRFTGFDKIIVKSDGLEVQVSDATWMNILGKTSIASATSTTIVSILGIKIGVVNLGIRAVQLFGSAIAKTGAGVAGGLIGFIIAFVLFDLPLILLQSIQTSGTGGTFFVPYAIFALVVFIFWVPLGISSSIVHTFKLQEMKSLNLFAMEL